MKKTLIFAYLAIFQTVFAIAQETESKEDLVKKAQNPVENMVGQPMIVSNKSGSCNDLKVMTNRLLTKTIVK